MAIQSFFWTAAEAAIIRARLEEKGTPIGPYDTLIAGVAKSKALTLVTNNVREFSRVEGLVVVNWVGVFEWEGGRS